MILHKLAILAIQLFSTLANSISSKQTFSIQTLIHNKFCNRMGATKLLFIYINSRALKYKWTFKKKREKQGPTWLTLLENEEIKMENANIEAEYADNFTIGAGNYSEMEDDDVWELVPEVDRKIGIFEIF